MPTCTPDPVTGLCIPPPTVSCTPPLLWHTVRCECGDGSLPTGYANGVPVCGAPSTPAPAGPTPNPLLRPWGSCLGGGCPPPAVPTVCEVGIAYPSGAPDQVMADVPPGCAQAGLELALVMLLARLKLTGAP